MMFRSGVGARLGFPRGRLWRAEARLSAPLGRLLLVLFLAKQEKYIPAPPKRKEEAENLLPLTFLIPFDPV